MESPDIGAIHKNVSESGRNGERQRNGGQDQRQGEQGQQNGRKRPRNGEREKRNGVKEQRNRDQADKTYGMWTVSVSLSSSAAAESEGLVLDCTAFPDARVLVIVRQLVTVLRELASECVDVAYKASTSL
ncbi:hypothetical protein KFL_004450120 [Klebsormidium nitens]|uniref:Uncharacterized protein n=1 Tax=Klebsormidium nitens TaxID=105231 RepID=A0A1Y1ICD3_KLENI|nr:hypothetical protein KFL_004450120 [Klebsormidium nitens]|eukprot:GAQ88625.1 hypothetical protein KFL_004450120 [Klebsormidium nitens]